MCSSDLPKPAPKPAPKPEAKAAPKPKPAPAPTPKPAPKPAAKKKEKAPEPWERSLNKGALEKPSRNKVSTQQIAEAGGYLTFLRDKGFSEE